MSASFVSVKNRRASEEAVLQPLFQRAIVRNSCGIIKAKASMNDQRCDGVHSPALLTSRPRFDSDSASLSRRCVVSHLDETKKKKKKGETAETRQVFELFASLDLNLTSSYDSTRTLDRGSGLETSW